MRTLLLASLYFFPLLAIPQDLYFPPINSDEWQTVEPQDLGWQVSKIPELYDFQARIADKLGHLLHVSQNQSQINLSNFQPGTYWVDISTKENIWRRKIAIHP